MATDEQLLKECGLSHIRDWHTFFTLVNLRGGKTPNKFYRHLSTGFKRVAKSKHAKHVRLVITGTTFGTTDLVVVWQAKDMEAAKAFLNNVLVGNTHSCNTMMCPIHLGFSKGP
jgi:hypothetical protein